MNTLCESEVLSHKIADNAETAHVEEGIRIKPVNVGMYNDIIVFCTGYLMWLVPQNLKRMVCASP